MEALAGLDPVAYVRFASVYKNFRETRDFEQFLETLSPQEREAVKDKD
jgi:transcriptional repressor NrdR